MSGEFKIMKFVLLLSSILTKSNYALELYFGTFIAWTISVIIYIRFFVEIYLSPAGQKEANNDGRWNTGRCTYFWLHNFNTEIRACIAGLKVNH